MSIEVGDTVRVINEERRYFDRKGEVKHIDSTSRPYQVKQDILSKWRKNTIRMRYSEDELELVKESQ